MTREAACSSRRLEHSRWRPQSSPWRCRACWHAARTKKERSTVSASVFHSFLALLDSSCVCIPLGWVSNRDSKSCRWPGAYENVTIYGSCDGFVDGVYFYVGMVTGTSPQAPYYKTENANGIFWMFWDPRCGGPSGTSTARWIIDEDEPNTTAAMDLDGDENCVYALRINSVDPVPTATGTWRGPCPYPTGSWVNQELFIWDGTSTTTTVTATTATATTVTATVTTATTVTATATTVTATATTVTATATTVTATVTTTSTAFRPDSVKDHGSWKTVCKGTAQKHLKEINS